jgi:hypothetical protein
MSTSSEIKAALRALVGIEDLGTSQLCTVVSVNETEMTCVVSPIGDLEADFADVRLMADTEDTTKGIYFKPVIGSVVMITPQDEVTYFVSMYSEVEEVWLRGNTNGGVVKVSDLVTKLNNLENDLNSLKTIFSTSWVPVPNDGGAALKTAAATWAGQSFTPTTAANIQSTTVKHG